MGSPNDLGRRRLLGSVSALAVSSLLPVLSSSIAMSQTTNESPPGPLMAIDVLLDPDQAMLQKAAAANARLRQSFPKGFALDETHQPHISMLQRFETDIAPDL